MIDPPAHRALNDYEPASMFISLAQSAPQPLLRYFLLGSLSTLELLFRLFRSPLGGAALTSDELFLRARRRGGDADLEGDRLFWRAAPPPSAPPRRAGDRVRDGLLL